MVVNAAISLASIACKFSELKLFNCVDDIAFTWSALRALNWAVLRASSCNVLIAATLAVVKACICAVLIPVS